MNQKIRDREVEKSYLCLILGSISPAEGKLEGYLLKMRSKAGLRPQKPVPGGRTAVTLYRTLARRNGLSLVACRLVTGRTHQIRAQFAAAGHPLLGDGKYGPGQGQPSGYGRTSGQALCSYQLTFRFTTDAGCLEPLNGRTWTVDRVDFVEEYFPGVALD